MRFAQQEQATYDAVWTGVANYGNHSPGAEQVGRFLEMSGATEGTVLDAGCGSGKGALALKEFGFDVTLADITPSGLVEEAVGLPFVQVPLWADLHPVAYAATRGRAFDYVYCCDVMEHVPTEFTMLVIARLLEVTKVGAFFSISTVPDGFGAWVGKPLHQTVQPYVWWRDHLSEFGELVEGRDVLNAGLFYVRPR